MSWFWLLAAGLLEIVWAVSMKYANGFTKLTASLITIGAMTGSVFFLALALKHLPLGTAYAIWTGIGAVGTAIAGMLLFAESTAWPRILCLLMISGGIVGLKMLTK